MDEALRQLMLQMQLRSLVGDPGVFGRIAADPPRDNRDMQVRAPGQNQFPNQMFGQLLHPNAAGVYGSGERLPPVGDVVLPSPGYRDASSRNAYMPQANESSTIRNFNESNIELQNPGTRIDGFRRIDYGDPLTQMMLQMQMRRMLQQVPGGNQLPAPVQRSIITQPSYAEDYVIPMPETQQRGYDMLLHEHAMEGTQHQRDQELSDALNRDRGRYVRLPEEYGGASVYEGPMQRISAAGGGADPLGRLMLQMGLRSMPDWEPPVPPPLPSQDVLYQDTSRGSPAQNARRDMEIVATPRPPSENIDELIRSGQPGIADPRMPISRSDLGNAQFNFAPGYLRRTAAGDGGDPVTQLMLQMQLQQMMGGDNSQFMQRPPGIGWPR